MEFLQPISLSLFENKYMINGETNPDQVFHDVAEEVSRPENPKIRARVRAGFEAVMTEGYLIPGGRILANARSYTHPKSRNYNNCFTIDIEDSMEGIYGAVYEDAMISRMGGGVGFDVSKLRPAGSKTTNGGDASGPISFLRVFNESAKTISSGRSRRAAHIALLDINHPDIESFITIKHGDEEKTLDKFNISIRITDAFMIAVEKDENWNLVFQGKIYKTLKARVLYDAFTRNAFMHNDPGVFFIDRVERDNNGWWAYKMDRCNPCLAGGTLIQTDKGLLPIQEVYSRMENGEEFSALSFDTSLNKEEYQVIEKAYLTKKNAEVIKLIIQEGPVEYEIICTPDHKIFTKNRGYVEARHLTGEDDIAVRQ